MHTKYSEIIKKGHYVVRAYTGYWIVKTKMKAFEILKNNKKAFDVIYSRSKHQNYNHNRVKIIKEN